MGQDGERFSTQQAFAEKWKQALDWLHFIVKDPKRLDVNAKLEDVLEQGFTLGFQESIEDQREPQVYYWGHPGFVKNRDQPAAVMSLNTLDLMKEQICTVADLESYLMMRLHSGVAILAIQSIEERLYVFYETFNARNIIDIHEKLLDKISEDDATRAVIATKLHDLTITELYFLFRIFNDKTAKVPVERLKQFLDLANSDGESINKPTLASLVHSFIFLKIKQLAITSKFDCFGDCGIEIYTLSVQQLINLLTSTS